ncbi:MAG: NADH/ubiquinone/plastoquinone (complex I) [Chloroflexi bacterium]|nr:NADH/ubiquinone/plastoquinone (complex I) [Chloroflexota bacterium]
MDQLPVIIPMTLLIFSLLTPILGQVWGGSVFAAALSGVFISTIASFLALDRVLTHGTLYYDLGGWVPPVGIEYVVDEVAAYVCVVITTVSFLVLISTRRWVLKESADRSTGTFYSLVLLLLGGLTGIVVTGDLFNLFVFLEISSLSAYALVFIGGRNAMLAGFRYLIIGSIGGAFYLLGVGFIYFATGTLNMEEARLLLPDAEATRAVQAGAVLIFAGLGLKMGLVPMHFWLPDAYQHAPSSVNSLISPIMTKVAAYAMLRMFLSVFPDGYLTNIVPVADALVILGLIGIAFGSIAAASQTDIRRMLAYSSISQLALIAVGIGLATPLAFVAALLHIVNHAAMKSTLFLAAASIRLQVGLQKVHNFAGLGRSMPVTMAAFTLSAISMVGIPPTAGFFSKWYMIQAGLNQGDWAVVVVILLSSLLTAVYLFKVLEQAYLRPAKSTIVHDSNEEATSSSIRAEVARSKESQIDVWAPLVILAVAIVAIGVFNVVIIDNILRPGVS